MDDEALKRQHEHDLWDRRMGEQRIIDVMSEKIDTKFSDQEKRLKSLERTRVYLMGLIGGAAFLWGRKGG